MQVNRDERCVKERDSDSKSNQWHTHMPVLFLLLHLDYNKKRKWFSVLFDAVVGHADICVVADYKKLQAC